MLIAAVWMLGCTRLVTAQNPAAAPITTAEVQQTIDRGVLYLFSIQHPNGGWNEWSNNDERQNCGASALAVLALLNCGVSPDEPRLKKGLDYLRGKKNLATYSAALQTMALCAPSPKPT
ncbi:MAG: hypothetical protein U0892_08845 [Pirellulales bacterium]